MLRSGGDQIDAGGLHRAVAQHIGQLHHIPAHSVEGPGKKVPQVVGKHFAGGHPRGLAQPLHLRPDLSPGQTFSASGEKISPEAIFCALAYFFQLPAQLSGEQNSA